VRPKLHWAVILMFCVAAAFSNTPMAIMAAAMFWYDNK
jgi:hypothetical protein